MKYAALGVLAAAFVLQIGFIYWMNSDVDRTPPRRARDPWLADEGTAHIYAIKPPQAGRDRFRATNPRLGQEVVHGYVYDAQGAAVVGALVLVEQRNLSPEATLAPNSRTVRWDASSDAAGYFVFDALPPGGFVVSAFGKDTHALTLCRLTQNGAAADVKLRLEPSAQLEGAVLDEAGTPLPNAFVYPLQAARGKGAEAYRYFPARTGKDGHFTLDHLRAGAWDLLVTARGKVPALYRNVAQSGQAASLKLDAGATLAGQITAQVDGGPVASITVSAVEAEFGLERYQARTDKQGHFRFQSLRPAEYVVRIDSNRWAEVETPAKFAAREGAPEAAIVVEKTGALRGRVLTGGPEADGVADIIVVASPKTRGGEVVEDETDLSGYYFFPGLKAGDYELALQLPEQFAETGTQVLPASVTANQRLEGPTFTIFAGSTAILGAVKDGDGAPVAGANVHVTFGDGGLKKRSTRSGSDGAFTFKGFGEQDMVTIWAEKLGRQSEAFGPVEMGKTGLNSVELKLSLSNGGSISGRVVNAQGAGIAGAPVTCTPAADAKAPTLRTITDASGAFGFQGLPPAACTLHVARSAQSADGGADREVTVAENQRVENVEVVLP